MSEPGPTGLETMLPDFTIPREKQPSATGRQEAHGFGENFVKERAKFLLRMFPGKPDARWGWNLASSPDTTGTGAITGTGVHSGQQVTAYDDLFYATGVSRKQVLNTIGQSYNDAVLEGDQNKIFELKRVGWASAHIAAVNWQRPHAK